MINESHLCDRLDASIALTVIEVMKRLSEKGKMIITVLHQPRAKIFNLIDRVMILGFLKIFVWINLIFTFLSSKKYSSWWVCDLLWTDS